jgi:AGCS family alanine or glycine:cation symporter
MVIRVLWVLTIVVGSITTLGFAWDLADTFNGMMIIPNLISIVLLSAQVVKLKKEYFDKELALEKRSGAK